jgi:hypothetical protein
MESKHRIVTALVVAATAMATSPAFAQNRHQPHAQNRASAPAAESQAQPRANADGQRRPNAAPRPAPVAPSAVAPSAVAPSQQRAVPRAVPRTYDSRAYGYGAHPQAVHPSYAHPSYARPYYAHPHYVRPYYSYYPHYVRPYPFRPYTTLQFGIVLGYPVPYSYYAYPYPVPVYGYGAPSGPVVVGPSSAQYGGVALEISPPDATVYVDGNYAGLVHDFDGREHTLTLAAGRHHIEISAPGFQTMVLDPDVYPGQVVPYQGSLMPY